MKTEANSTAFPSAGISNYEETNVVGGLTKREHFAALAMAGLVTRFVDIKNIAETAVKIADALIEALNEEKK